MVINGEEMTAEQALIRSMFLNGIRGKVTPQRMALKYREESEKAAKQAKADHIEKAVQYQIAMRQEIKRCRQAGLPDPEMPFHPDEIQINFYTGEIRYVTLFGPRDEPPPELGLPSRVGDAARVKARPGGAGGQAAPAQPRARWVTSSTQVAGSTASSTG